MTVATDVEQIVLKAWKAATMLGYSDGVLTYTANDPGGLNTYHVTVEKLAEIAVRALGQGDDGGD